MTFEHPGWLVLLLLLIPVLWWSRRARITLGPIRGVLVPFLRCLLIVVLALALADPNINRQSDQITVAVVLDRSSSILPGELDTAIDWLQQATQSREVDEQLAVVDAARTTVVVMMPDAHGQIAAGPVQGPTDGSNLAGGLEFAKGLLPEGGVHRLLLVSDGNETSGSLLDAADQASRSGIPIDVLPIQYHRSGEVMVDRVIAPRTHRPGERIPLQIVMRSEGPATGSLRVTRDGVEIGDGIEVDLPGGVAVRSLSVPSGAAAVERFDVRFEPQEQVADTATRDRRLRNNTAAAISVASGRGRIALVVEHPDAATSLETMLASRGFDIEIVGVEALLGGPTSLSAWDAIALLDVPRWSLPDRLDQELAAWVRDGGGGLLLSGGPTGLGAGGWIGSEVADLLPVNLDPPAERISRPGALALVLHACEMPQGNYWGRRVAEAAIEALSSEDYVGIVEYDARRGEVVWPLPMQRADTKAAALSAAANLRYGDMPSFQASMQMAFDGLIKVEAGRRHMVIISDGDPQPPSEALLLQCADAGVTVTTVMVGGHGTAIDRRRMRAIAVSTGGRFYDVQDPDQLPQIFIEESQVVSRSLIQQGNFSAGWIGPSGGPFPQSAIASLSPLPGIKQYILTAALGGLAANAVGIMREDQADPLLAWRIAGLGRTSVWSSAFIDNWGGDWLVWSGAGDFWSRLFSWLRREADGESLSVDLVERGDGQIDIEVEAADQDEGFLNFLQLRAAILGPGGVGGPVDLVQVGPGRYAGTFEASQAGGWVVAIQYEGVAGSTGEAVSGWVQESIVRNWPREDAAVRSREALLHEVAQRSG
ncbi:MAG: VWA domain-containing protein, partial [Phycisphaerales bacterium]|nr:VWA domain-containing protein [Phycisphaerales bacterium]